MGLFYEKKSLLVLTSGNFLEALGSRIGTGSIFCLSFSLSNRVLGIRKFRFSKKVRNVLLINSNFVTFLENLNFTGKKLWSKRVQSGLDFLNL